MEEVSEKSNLEGTEEFKLISALTQPDTTLPSTIHHLLNITNIAAALAASDDQSTLDSHIKHTFSSLWEMAARTAPQDQAVLIGFLRELAKQQVINPDTEEPLRFSGFYDTLVWAELPLLGVTIADDWNSS